MSLRPQGIVRGLLISAGLLGYSSLGWSQDEPTLPEIIVEPTVPSPSDQPLREPVAPIQAPGSAIPSVPATQPALNASVPSNSMFDGGIGATSPSWNSDRLTSQMLGSSTSLDANSGILRSRTSLFETPAAASIVSRQDLVESQATDMFGALQHEVGVLMQSTAAGQASPFVRGVTGQQVLILVDGIRLNNSIFRFGPNQYLGTIDPGMVDHIEVLRGQGSVLWGSDAIGGAINVETISPGAPYRNQLQQSFNTANSASYTRGTFQSAAGNAQIIAGGSYYNVRDLDTAFAFGRQPGTNYDQHAGDIKLNYQLDADSMLTVALQHVEQEGLPRSDRFPGYPGDLDLNNTPGGARFFDPQQRDLVYLRYQALSPTPLIDALTLTASYHRQREIQTRGIPNVRAQETDVDTVGVNLVAAKQLGCWTSCTFGVDWYHDDVDSNFSGTASGPIVPDDAFYERLGGFANFNVQLTDRLSSTAGVRYELIDLAATPQINNQDQFIASQYDDVISQVGLVYELANDVLLVGSISEGFRAPNLDELTANNPNVLQQGRDLPSLGLVPETSVSYEVGIKTDGQRLRTQTFVYWLDLENNIVPISAGPDQFQRGNQDSIVQGAEFDGEYWLRRGWSLFGNVTYTYGRNEVTGGALSRIPPTQGIIGLRWRDPCATRYASVYAWLVRDQDRLDPVRDFGDERIPDGGTPGFHTLHARFGQHFGDANQYRLSLNLDNITDQPYLVHGSGVFGTGFSAKIGLTWIH